MFEDVAPADYLTRLAASGWGQAYKQLAAAELGIRAGDTVLDLGCGPGPDLPAFAAAAGFRAVRVIPATAVFRDVRAADQVLGLRRVTVRAVTAGYLTPEQAGPWLDHLATEPFFASATLFVTAAAAS